MSYNNGNKFAEKWNEETVMDKLKEIEIYLNENTKEYLLKGCLTKVGLHIDWWADMSNKFADNENVFRTIKDVETIIEQRIVNDTMSGDAKSATFSIFLLKNKFGYVDKVETETNNIHTVKSVNLKEAIKFDGDNPKQ